MTTDRELDEILSELGREHRAIGAPDKLVHVLRTEAINRVSATDVPRLRFAWTWTAAAILLAVVATVGIIWQMRRGHQPPNQQVRTVPVLQVKPELTPPSEGVTESPGVQAKSVQAKSALRHRSRTQHAGLLGSSRQPESSISLDEFVALPVSEGLPHAAELSVVRIQLRGSDLQQYGLQAPPDAVARTMLAEFVVGEDGLPRAIRIVR